MLFFLNNKVDKRLFKMSITFIQNCPELFLVGSVLTSFILNNKINQIESRNIHTKYYNYYFYDKSLYALCYGSLLLSNVVFIHASVGSLLNLATLFRK